MKSKMTAKHRVNQLISIEIFLCRYFEVIATTSSLDWNTVTLNSGLESLRILDPRSDTFHGG